MARMHTEKSLQGLNLIVTRPKEQGANTAKLLRDAGAKVIEFPLLSILPIETSIAPAELNRATALIFVSANAVAFGAPALRRSGEITHDAQVFAIGRATAAALRAAGFKDVVVPQQSIDSEGLLALPQLHRVGGRHIIIVKGRSESGGRTLLEETLVARGAHVTLFDCYRRSAAVPDTATCDMLKQSLASGLLHGCFALSVDTLDSLMNNFLMMNIAPQAQLVMLVPNARVAAAVRANKFDKIVEVPLDDAGMLVKLADLKMKYFSSADSTRIH
jgi:uroporphyrinogen-III synthase